MGDGPGKFNTPCPQRGHVAMISHFRYRSIDRGIRMPGDAASCANCGAGLNGPYCSACGQRADHHVLTMREFLAEALEGVTHADSRLWRTLAALVSKPAFLTREFVAGRRASYLPPFRLYLVLSVVFFLVVPLTAHIGDAGPRATGVNVVTPLDAPQVLRREIDAATDPGEKAALQDVLRRAEALRAKLAPATAADATCTTIAGVVSMPPWLQPRAVRACEKIRADNGSEAGRSILHNLGRAMLVMLPLFALFMKAQFWRAGRLYVEHLLLLLHNHALVFLAMSVLLVAERLIPSETAAAALGWLFSLYIGWYLYESLRRFYGQGPVSTLFKFAGLATAYSICVALMLVLTALYSVATL